MSENQQNNFNDMVTEDCLSETGFRYFVARLKTIITGLFQPRVPGKGLSTNDYTNEDKALVQTITDKAEKDTDAVPGNFSEFDANGNPVDSGHKHSDYMPASYKGSANGVAELDQNGMVPANQLPSYVDDIIDGYYVEATGKFYQDAQHTIEIHGEAGKIYFDITNETTRKIVYRWSGSAFVPIPIGLALGETAETAYRGDRGKAAYDHAQAKGSQFASGFYKVATNAEGHVTGATPVQRQDVVNLGINDDRIVVQDETPTDPDVNVWLPETPPPGIQIPTYAEHQQLEGEIDAISESDDLLRDELPGTAKVVTMNADNKPVSIVHSRDGSVVRTDVLTWLTGSMTEVRTLASGKYITIVTNLVTFAQTISDIQEATT